MFELAKIILDEQTDKRERIIRISRDLTLTSKKLIFSLQRFSNDLLTDLPQEKKPKLEIDGSQLKELQDFKTKQEKLLDQLQKEIQNEDYYKYHRSFRPGLQEYIESRSLEHFLMTRQLLPYTQVWSIDLKCDLEDYLLGILDFTGELMRICIQQIGQFQAEFPLLINELLCKLSAEFQTIRNLDQEMEKKKNTLEQSQFKCQSALFHHQLLQLEQI